MRHVVSVESLPVPARGAILKSLQTGLGLALAPDDGRAAQGSPAQLAALLRRMRALARAPDNQDVLWTGPWLPAHAPEHLRQLHRDLALALAEDLARPPGKHVMLCLEGGADEAFEALVSAEDANAKHVDLRCLAAARDAVSRVASGQQDALSPFPVEVVRLPYPAFAADNPAVLAKLADLACQACRRCMQA